MRSIKGAGGASIKGAGGWDTHGCVPPCRSVGFIVLLSWLAAWGSAVGFPETASAAIVAVLEEPSGKAAGIGNVRGWAFSDAGGTINTVLEVFIDGAPSIEVPCCSSRGDVAAANPGAPVRSGFSGIFNWSLLTDGEHQIRVRITSSIGETKDLTATFTVARIGSARFLNDLDLDNEGLGDCINIGDDLCCEDVAATPNSGGGPLVCSVCYNWMRASQSLVLTSSSCDAL